MNIEELKNKCEIIIKDLEEIKLGIITYTKKAKKSNGPEMISGFVHYYSNLNRDEQRGEFQ